MGLYYICIVAALWGTLQALPEIYARVTQEFLSALWPDKEWGYVQVQRVSCTYIFLVAMIVLWMEVPFDTLIQIVGFIAVNLALAIIMVAALYLNYKLPAAYHTGRTMLLGTAISCVIIVVIAVISGWSLAGKLFGS